MTDGVALESGKRRGIPGSTVKIIAVLVMLIDHIAAVFLTRILISRGAYSVIPDEQSYLAWLAENEVLYWSIIVMRSIGRLGFPIFCFLLVEGFQKTKNIRKYIFRLGLFALVSEVPFDLALAGQPWHLRYQNVYFTLLIGILALWGFSLIERRGLAKWLQWLMMAGVLAAAMAAADLLRTDYGGMGVLTIAVMYILRRKKVLAAAGGCVVLTCLALSEAPAFIALLPIALYNGERGLKMKYFFYAFYPVHLLILYLICLAAGMGGISVI